jgi:hypothetical protein
MKKKSVEETDNSTSLYNIEVIFTIHYIISNGSILNQTVLITDPIHNQLLPSLIFIIDYSTNEPFPHNVCLYLLLLTTSLKEIFLCRTINNDMSPNDHGTSDDTTSGPSVIFILLQALLIVLMMLFISLTQTAKKNSVIDRINKRLFRHKPAPRNSAANILEETINRKTTKNEIQLNNFIPKNTEEQVCFSNSR